MERTVELKNRVVSYDLHIHSNFSDGTYTPYQIIDIAKQNSLKGISITDHDELVAEDSINRYAKEQGLDFIQGIEFSTKFVNVHIIGYALDPENEKLQNFLAHQRKERENAVIKMCEKSKKMNIPINFDECIKDREDKKIIGRPHIARVMVEKGYVKDIYEAFRKYLYTNGPLFVDYKKFHYIEIINLIKNANGISVLAHPGLIPPKNQEFILFDCIKNGIKGLEVFYPRHTPTQTEKFYGLCEKYGLLVTGGSDFHGEVKPDIRIGVAGLTDNEFLTLRQHIYAHSDG